MGRTRCSPIVKCFSHPERHLGTPDGETTRWRARAPERSFRLSVCLWARPVNALFIFLFSYNVKCSVARTTHDGPDGIQA
jgi:hypothetical protein